MEQQLQIYGNATMLDDALVEQKRQLRKWGP